MKHRVWTFALVLTLCAALLTAGAMAADMDAQSILAAAETAVAETAAEEESALLEEATEEAAAEEEAETLLSGGVEIAAAFPDEIFRTYVSEKFDTDGNKYLSAAEIAAVTMVSIGGKGIADLTGIEYFKALENLYCPRNELTTLDVSGFSALQILNCEGNALTELNVNGSKSLVRLYCRENALTTLDVSDCTALFQLECANNGMTELNISGCTALQVLDCIGNELTTLDLTGHGALITLGCSENALTALDLSDVKSLRTLMCDRNALTALDVRGFAALKQLNCEKNLLTELELTGCTALKVLSCWDNSIETLDIYENEYLVQAYAEGNKVPSDTIVTYYGNDNAILTVDAAMKINAGGAEAKGISVDGVSFPDATFRQYVLDNFDTDGNKYLSDAEIADVKKIYVGDMGISDLTGIELFTELTSLNCVYNQLTELNVSANTKLTSLTCGGNALTALDVSKNTSLSILSCWENKLTELNVSANTALTELYCHFNNLTELNVSANTKLTSLNCVYNQLTELNVSANTELVRLQCGTNQLTELDVSANTALTLLNCNNNQLRSLNVSANTELENLNCCGNGINMLNIAGCEKLLLAYTEGDREEMEDGWLCYTYILGGDGPDKEDSYRMILSVDDNTVIVTPDGVPVNEILFPDEAFRTYVSENLDTDKNGYLSEAEIAAVTCISMSTTGVSDLTGLEYFTALEELYCTQHSLTTLDVSANKALVVLKCGLGNLRELNVSGNAALEELYCYNNGLTSLDVSGCNALKVLDCEYNDLTGLDVSTNENLTTLSCANNEMETLNIAGNENMVRTYTEGICHDYGADGLWYAIHGENEYGDEITLMSLGVDPGTKIIVPGDADGDGKVEPKDLTRLMKSILKVDGNEVSPETADLNNDDVVDILDVICLVRMLAGIDTPA